LPAQRRDTTEKSIKLKPNRNLNLKITHIVFQRLFGRDAIDAIGQKAEESADPQKHGKAAEKVLAKLDPFGRFWRRSQGIGAVARQNLARLIVRYSLKKRRW